MIIRRLTAEHAAAYRALRMRALREHPEAFMSSVEVDELQPIEATIKRVSGNNNAAWGAFEGGELIGYVGFERETKPKAAHKAKVVGMYVAPEHTGAGTGKALLEAFIAHSRSVGVEMVVLTVTEGNAGPTALYERMGFRSFGIEPRAMKIDGRYLGKNHMYLEIPKSIP